MNKIFYYGLTKENFYKCKTANDEYPRKMTKYLSYIGAVAMFVFRTNF